MTKKLSKISHSQKFCIVIPAKAGIQSAKFLAMATISVAKRFTFLGDDAVEATTPSTELASREQIGKVQDLFGAELVKANHPKNAFQMMLEKRGKDLAGELAAVVAKFVAMVANLVVRVVTGIRRDRTPREALEATGRQLYVNDDVVASMPKGEGEFAELAYYKPDRYFSSNQAALDGLAEDGWEPVDDPVAVIADMEANPAFADDRPVAVLWKDAQGRICWMVFLRWYDERHVGVYRYDSAWDERWWFAVCPKKTSDA